MWTMLQGFEHLRSEELTALLEAPVLITVLVGAADGKLDREERRWSERLMKVRTYAKPHLLADFYRVAGEGFLDKLDKALFALPEGVEERSALINDKLAALNPVLAKLEEQLAAALYKSFRVLAHETAKASGGFLRIGAVSAVESEWIGLPMLTPLHVEGQPDLEDLDEWEESDDN